MIQWRRFILELLIELQDEVPWPFWVKFWEIKKSNCDNESLVGFGQNGYDR